MTLDEVLALENDKKSIKKIDMFLRDKNETSYEYARAIAYKALILHNADRDKDALRILLSLSVNFNKFDNLSVCALCDSLIEIFLALDNNDQALKYIDIKNEHLKTIDKDQYLYDMIRYYDSVGNRVELKRTITLYLYEDISEENRIKALEKLLYLIYYDKDYDNFYDTYNKLEAYYLKSFKYENLYKITLLKADVLFNERKFNELTPFIMEYIQNKNVDSNTKVGLVTILLNMHLLNGENRKAMILESEYHDIYENADVQTKLNFAKVALEVSKIIQNRFGVEEYNEKIEEFEQELKDLKKSIKKEKKKSVNINIVEDEIDYFESNVESIDIKTSNRKEHFEENVKNVVENSIDVSERFKRLEGALSALNPNKGVRFRDILRNYGIEIDNLFSKCEIVVSLDKNGMGFHYKVSRVYEKTFTDEMIKDTPFEELLSNSTKLLLINIKESLWDKDIITNMPYSEEFKTVIGFRLYRNDTPIGAILYNFKTSEFKDVFIYETLKILTMVLNVHINNLYDEYDKSKTNMMYEFITKHAHSGIKVEVDREIKLNESARLLLGINQSNIDFSEYLSKIDSKDVALYKEIYRRIYERETNEGTLYYHINGRYVKEDIMVNTSSVLEIYSIITDETAGEVRKEYLESKAYNNDISKLKNKSMLYLDIENVLDTKKFALVLFSVDDYKTYFDIYGYKFADDLTLLLGKILKKIEDNKMSIYHLDNDKFMILFKDNNDLRAIKHKTSLILDTLKREAFEVNPRLKLKLKAGIFRYTKAMSVTDVRKIINYASEALIDARDNDLDFATYDNKNALNRFRDSQIILYCTEAIDTRELKINYKQFVNTKEGTIDYYVPRANLVQFDCDEKYFYEVVSKRDIKKMFDKYIINETLLEEKTFYEKTKVYFPIMIPIHKSFLMDKRFKAYLEQKLKFLKIPSKLLSFEIIDDNDIDNILDIRLYLSALEIKLASKSFDLVTKNKLDIFICDKNNYNLVLAKALKSSLDELNIDFYMSNVNSKTDIKKIEEIGINTITGDILRDNSTIDSLIEDYSSNIE